MIDLTTDSNRILPYANLPDDIMLDQIDILKKAEYMHISAICYGR